MQEAKEFPPPIEFQIRERIKCTTDAPYYLETYGYLYDAGANRMGRMNPYGYQKKCVRKFDKYSRNIILKSRQCGISAITAGYAAQRLMFYPDQRIIVISKDLDSAEDFLKAVKGFVENTPAWLRPDKIVKNNNTNLELSNGSMMQAKASSPEAGRSKAATLLILDEAAFIKDIDAIWTAASLTLSMTNGKCIMISTPKGTGNLYHKTWVGALNKDTEKNNGFHATRVHWTENPICAKGLETREDTSGKNVFWSPWYEIQCKTFNYDPVIIAQELDLSFEGSQYLAIEADLIRKYEKRISTERPICYIKYDMLHKGTTEAGEFIHKETNFYVWKKPEPGKKYIISCDVSRGDGHDYSTIQILEIDSLEQCAEYRDKISTDLFSYVIDWVARQYNEAFVAIEANSFGLVVCFDMRNKRQYKRLFYSKNIQKMQARGGDYDFSVDEGVQIPGFQTSWKTRPMVVTALKTAMREDAVGIHSLRLMSELNTFIMKGDKPEADKGYNDDLIMAMCIGLYIRGTEYSKIAENEKMYRAMLDGMSFGTAAYSQTDRDRVVMERKKKTDGIEMSKEEATKMVVPPGAGGLFINKGAGLEGTDENSRSVEDDMNDLSWLYD